MAKVLPAGTNVNLNLGQDSYTKLMNTLNVVGRLQGIAGNISANKAKQDTTLMNSLIAINSQIDKADDIGDLEFVSNQLNDINPNNITNDNVKMVYEIAEKNLSDSNQSFSDISNLGNELGSIMTQQYDVYDSESGLTVKQSYDQMTSKDVQSYFGSLIKDEGSFGAITKYIEKINVFESQLAKKFGVKDGKIAKTPNMKFKDANGNEINSTEYLIQLNKFKNRLNIMVEAGFMDKVLNEQEAMTIISGDYNAYSNLKKQKEQEFKFLSTQDNSLINGINTKINTIQNSSDDDFFTGGGMQIMEAILKEDPNNIDTLKEFMDKGGMDSSKLKITDDAEINNQLAVQEFSKMTKGQNLQFLYEYKARIEKKRIFHRDAARSWGFGFYGLAPSPNDLGGNPATDPEDILTGSSEETDAGAAALLVPKDISTGSSEETVSEEFELENQELKDNDGVNKDDDGVNYVPATVATITATGAGIYYADKITDAAKYINSVTNLDGKTITNLLEDTRGIADKTYNQIEIFDKSINDELKEIDELKAQRKKLKTPKAKKPFTDKILNKTKNLNNIRSKRVNYITNQANSLKRFYGGNIEDIKKLFGFGKTNKVGNLFKIKSDLISKKLPIASKFLKGKYIPFTIGTEVATALGGDDLTSQVVGGVTGVAVTEGAKKIIKSPTVRNKTIKYVSDMISKKAAKKLATAGTGWLGGPVVGTVTTLISAGLFVKDIYDIANYLLSEDEITEEESQALKEAADDAEVQKSKFSRAYGKSWY